MQNSPTAQTTQTPQSTLQQPPFSLSSPTSRKVKPRIRRNFPRSKSGCLTCRSRRKKCDETAPICRNCDKRKVQCSWPSPEVQEEVSLPKHTDFETPIKSPTTRLILGSASNGISSLQTLNKSTQSSSSHPGTTARVWYLQWSIPYTRDSLLTSSSRLLFDRYLSQASNQLGIAPISKNPFVYYVLPLAFSNELVMNCVLALSGAHFCCDEAVDAAIISATWSHYSFVLRDLQIVLSNSTPGDGRETLHLLLVTLLLCIVDIISGSSHSTILHHLIASRHLVLNILASPSLLSNPDNLSLWGFLLEMYSYRALAASVTPRGNLSSHTVIELDSFLGDLEGLRQYSSYGIFFGCGHGVFEFIPMISSLIAHRLPEDSSPIPTPEMYARYEVLESKLRDWKPAGSDMTIESVTAAIIYQNALLIYLHSFFHPFPTSASLLSEIEIRTEICFPLLLSLSSSRLEGIILWPVMMIGSCLQKDEEREMLREAFEKSRYKMRSVKGGIELLEYLWGDSDPRAFGPQGLDYVMKRKELNLCFS